jgi:hypothetical protein
MIAMNPEMMQCIETCRECARVCLSTATNQCLEMGGEHVAPMHFRTMLDCAEICETAADFMLRNSYLHTSVCRACAEVCEACAVSCEQIGDMQECVDVCRRCASECRKMAQATPNVPMPGMTQQRETRAGLSGTA